jgi:hypothetical protein
MGSVLFDQQALHHAPFGPGLVRDQPHADDLAREVERLAASFATLTPPPLPRPPAWICAFTTTRGAFRKQLARYVVGLFERVGYFALGHGHAVFSQDFFRLILVDFHLGWDRLPAAVGVAHKMSAAGPAAA